LQSGRIDGKKETVEEEEKRTVQTSHLPAKGACQ